MVAREYANNGKTCVTYRESPANDVRIETKDALPKRIGEDGHRRCVRAVIFGCDRSANQDWCAVAPEEVARYHLRMCQNRNAACIDRHVPRVGKGKNIGESLCLFSEVLVCRIWERSVVEHIRLGASEVSFTITHHRPIMSRITCPVDHTQLMRIAYRQRLVQDAVDHTEDRRIRSNTQGQ